ncbi:hypothetical protein GCM10028818_33130 [Spirosoma horti]
MKTLQISVARLFPDAYTADNWPALLPRLIDHLLDNYQQQIEKHTEEVARWQLSDQSTPRPNYPVLPAEYGLACEQQALREGLNFRALACCLYSANKRIQYYQQKANSGEGVNKS